MLGFLSFIPVIGKVADVISGYFTKRMDVDLEKYKVKGKIDEKAIEADIAIIQARANLAAAMKDDPGTRLARTWIMLPASVYFGISFYYYGFANLLPPFMVWKPLEPPASLEYVVYAIIAYLFVTAWRGR